MTNMRDQIAEIIENKLGHAGLEYIANDILAALPAMIAPLVWEQHSSNSTAQQKHFYSGRYTLILMHDGYLVEFSDLSLGHGYSLGVAKSLADSHHRASIMAVFTGATNK